MNSHREVIKKAFPACWSFKKIVYLCLKVCMQCCLSSLTNARHEVSCGVHVTVCWAKERFDWGWQTFWPHWHTAAARMCMTVVLLLISCKNRWRWQNINWCLMLTTKHFTIVTLIISSRWIHCALQPDSSVAQVKWDYRTSSTYFCCIQQYKKLHRIYITLHLSIITVLWWLISNINQH